MLRVNRVCFLRTGFLRTDPSPGSGPYHFIDPDDPLFATANEFRYTDDPTQRAPVLERSNVGMGMLLTNDSAGMNSLPFVNTLYTRLRDLEVNTLKRFTALTMSDKKEGVIGLTQRQLLLLNHCMQDPDFSELADKYLHHVLVNQADLAFLVSDYYKPLITLLNGSNSGVALASLSNYSASYQNSKFSFDITKFGFVPTGGLSFTLAKTPWNIGEWMLLTNRTISGSNLIFSGLTKRWMSPEAIPFMEITSEHKLEMSEKDGTSLLSEHFLIPKDFTLKSFVPAINDAFASNNVSDIFRNLEKISNSSDSKQSAFAKECIEEMKKNCPLAMQLSLSLVKKARSYIVSESESIERDFGYETLAHIQSKPRLAQSEIYKPALIKSLSDEISVAKKLLKRSDFGAIKSPANEFFSSTPSYTYRERSDFPLSSHPKLRRHHPDYNAETGLDHDPIYMQNELVRWNPEFLKNKLDKLRSAASGLSIADVRNRSDIRWF